MRGAMIVLTGLLLFTGVLGWKPYQKYKLDREVDRLCAIDGGVRVYETVTLPKEDFGPNGEVMPQYRTLPVDNGRYGPGYYLRMETRLMMEGSPSLEQSIYSIVRRSDGRILGARTNFVRRGGDYLGLSPDSTYSCLNVLSRDSGLESLVFIPQKGEK